MIALKELNKAGLLTDENIDFYLSSIAGHDNPDTLAKAFILLESLKLPTEEGSPVNQYSNALAHHADIGNIHWILKKINGHNLLTGPNATIEFKLVMEHLNLNELASALLKLASEDLLNGEQAHNNFMAIASHENPERAIALIEKLVSLSDAVGRATEIQKIQYEKLIKYSNILHSDATDNLWDQIPRHRLTDQVWDNITKLCQDHINTPMEGRAALANYLSNELVTNQHANSRFSRENILRFNQTVYGQVDYFGHSPETRHEHYTQEELHTAELESWQTIFNSLKSGTLSITDFYGTGADNRRYEGAINDTAHLDTAREVARGAADFLAAYLPTDKKQLIQTIESLINHVKAIPDKDIRRYSKFAIDRLLRDNEDDMTTNFRGRQLAIASWAYLNSPALEGGANEAELNTFYLGLRAYIDSGDHSTAPTGDKSTGLNFSQGVFESDEEVKSDAGLDPACYGRLRNLCSSMLSINNAITSNQRMLPSTASASSTTVLTNIISSERIRFLSQTYPILKFINAKKSDMDNKLFDKLTTAFEEGYIKKADEDELVSWFASKNMPKSISLLQEAMVMIQQLQDQKDGQSLYTENSHNENYFLKIDACLELVDSIKQKLMEKDAPAQTNLPK